MNADEIREAAKAVDAACKSPEMERLSAEDKAKALLTIAGTLAFSMVCEVAAQLAEANDSLKCIVHPLQAVDRDEKTLRDEFAMVALRGAFMCDPTDFWKGSGKIDSPSERQAIVQRAYLWAESMMEARKK